MFLRAVTEKLKISYNVRENYYFEVKRNEQ